MTVFWPTTTISILRGTTTTAAGDVVDSDTPVHTGVPASVMERTRTGIDSVSQDMRVYRYTTCRLAAGTDVLDTDRILDERTGKKYSIAAVSVLGSPVHTPDLRLDLTYVN
ncbi:MAG TPA: hypothetical protein VGS97_20320 [Actinocrinis sp.]|uniref:hypothetical protein n=1 Tax=Actinocrinis sp. TaxID=1920516 RepID=UPI002DDCBF67|nr:hypothetical protein [Actinocrinis sp.]HEV2346456.1 hypothetical protein [Actinocrinis sp.]